jgi:hypothetical protein
MSSWHVSELGRSQNRERRVKLMVSKHNDLKRPSRKASQRLAGDVKARILNAAQRVFLKRGYQGSSLDEIAGWRRRKLTICPLRGKEALFEVWPASSRD